MIDSIIITDLDTAVSASFKETKQNAWISAVDGADQNKIRMIKKNFSQRGTLHFAQYFFDWSDEDNDVYIQKHIEDALAEEILEGELAEGKKFYVDYKKEKIVVTRK